MKGIKPAAVVIAGASLLVAVTGAIALAGPRPGMWTSTAHIVSNGQPAKDTSHDSCLTAGDLNDPGKKMVPDKSSPEESCKRIAYQWNGRNLNWKIACSGRADMNSSGTIVFDTAEHYTGTIEIDGNVMGHPITSNVKLEGHRIGECTK